MVDGAVVESPKKKIKLAEAATEKKVETITVEQEFSTPADKKTKKKKNSGQALTAVEAAG